MENKETITISKEQLEKYIEDSIRLSFLENAGVDNWSGYEYAFQELGDEDDAIEELVKEELKNYE